MNIEISDIQYERELNWNDAIFYCQLLVIDDKCDWRLPTKEELNYIYNSKNDLHGLFYWSSTEYDYLYAWYQSFTIGYQDKYLKYTPRGIRPVRNI